MVPTYYSPQPADDPPRTTHHPLQASGGISSGQNGYGYQSFEKFIDSSVLPCYPNLSPTWELAEDGTVIRGPVMHKTDLGPDRLGPSTLPARMRAVLNVGNSGSIACSPAPTRRCSL